MFIIAYSFGDKNLQLRYKFMTISLIMIGAAVIEHGLRYATITVATGLSEKYKHLNESVINSLSKQGCDAINWHQCRKKYALLSNLVKETDNFISPLILLSYSTNLYFICIQLFNGIFVSANGKLSYVYFFMSFILILGRIFAITLSAARIHNQSTSILPKIYCCPSSSFSRETERLQYQLTNDDVTLTGMKFFSITRTFMLALVSAIVTYELIILQFGE
ncbi:gustatory receptor for sugar taste 64f-like, partial [Aphidius gifuensis]|uniref:gustatory receptor for sugar taste 64f-like n=1 Tax=Aphidius gifuensis TaxID=684658 RepID=UPI001CDC2751